MVGILFPTAPASLRTVDQFDLLGLDPNVPYTDRVDQYELVRRADIVWRLLKGQGLTTPVPYTLQQAQDMREFLSSLVFGHGPEHEEFNDDEMVATEDLDDEDIVALFYRDQVGFRSRWNPITQNSQGGAVAVTDNSLYLPNPAFPLALQSPPN